MFRAPLCPSSGARDYTAIYNMWETTPWFPVVGGQVQASWLCIWAEGYELETIQLFTTCGKQHLGFGWSEVRCRLAGCAFRLKAIPRLQSFGLKAIARLQSFGLKVIARLQSFGLKVIARLQSFGLKVIA
jgi:hypothetical protein